jgi:S-adenosylmethionine:tRNA ribosyltransferase-isomerase
MEVEPFDYPLLEENIAQRPADPPDHAKLLVVDRRGAGFTHSRFTEFARFLSPDDLVVFNDTKVIPARLFGRLPQSGVEVEVLLLEEEGTGVWRCVGRPLKKIEREGRVLFGESLEGRFEGRRGAFEFVMRFSAGEGSTTLHELRRHGSMPIPPYIRRGRGDSADERDYQTIFARVEGSVAAPTASLHFTPAVMAEIERQGTRRLFVTLHVGAASFRSLLPEGAAELVPPEEERFSISSEAAEAIRRQKERGGRVVGVGTTVARALETFGVTGRCEGRTDLFIRPGHRFTIVDALVTNFHQPRTTHLFLVEALLGRSRLEESYRTALLEGYRFLSYGDGMFIS